MKNFTILLSILLSFIVMSGCTTNSTKKQDLTKFIKEYNEASKEFHEEYDYPLIPQNESDWGEKTESIVLNQYDTKLVSSENYRFMISHDSEENLFNYIMTLKGDNSQKAMSEIGKIFVKTFELDEKTFNKSVSFINDNWDRSLEQKKPVINSYKDNQYTITIFANANKKIVDITISIRN